MSNVPYIHLQMIVRRICLFLHLLLGHHDEGSIVVGGGLVVSVIFVSRGCMGVLVSVAILLVWLVLWRRYQPMHSQM